MKSWAIAIAVGLVGIAIGVVIGMRARPAPSTTLTTPTTGKPAEARVLRDVIARDAIRVDLYLPAPTDRLAPWIMFAHERGWPAPDEKERIGAGIADAMLLRGIGVAVVSFAPSEAAPLTRCGELVAEGVRELARRASQYGLMAEPVLAGDEGGASLVASLALDPHYGLPPATLRGVIAMNGDYGLASDSDAGTTAASAPTKLARADAPPFLILSAHADSPRSAQSSRALARALEHAGAKGVRSHHVSTRDSHSLTNLSGERNEVGDLVAAFVRGEPTPGGAEGTWALGAMWGASGPMSSEAFWADERLVVRRPTDIRFRAQIRGLFGEMARDLEPWPAATYDAIDLADYLRAHPELGSGDWVEVTNARDERLVLRRDEIERKKVAIVVGVDDERNLFRLFVTYNVYKTYSWKPETNPRPLLVRSVGAFLHVPTPPGRGADAVDGLHVATLADFALTPKSFHVSSKDPLARARALPAALAATLTNQQGCLQCHSLHGEGARAHHVRAADGTIAEAFGLPLEEYPREVLRRFLFEQEAVAKSFGVGPLLVSEAVATQLLAEASR